MFGTYLRRELLNRRTQAAAERRPVVTGMAEFRRKLDRDVVAADHGKHLDVSQAQRCGERCNAAELAEVGIHRHERKIDPLRIQRLKKKKLALKDRIVVLEDQLLPDIIA